MEDRDIFLCHASKDKECLARPLYGCLTSAGLTVWFDEAEIQWGDKVLAKISEGLQRSRYVLVCLSENFCDKNGRWRFTELDTAISQQIDTDRIRVLPLLCGVTTESVKKRWPILATYRFEELDFQSGQALSGDSLRSVVQRLQQGIVLSDTPRIIERSEIDRLVGTLAQRIERALEEVRISGNSCAFIVSESHCFRTALAKEDGPDFFIMCVDPDSQAPEMLARFDPEFPTAEDFRKRVTHTIDLFRELDANYDRFHFRLLPIAPAMGFFMVDPNLRNGIVKVEIYTAKPWANNTRPHLLLPPNMVKWRQYFVSQWDNYWCIASPLKS